MTERSAPEVGAVIDAIVAPPADRLVSAYFDPTGPFAASTFDTVGDNPADQIIVDDLLAVTLLNVVVPPPSVRLILGADRPRLTTMLAAVDESVPLWHASDELLVRATVLWDQLRTYAGVDWVTAGKLLARKRPQLIPIIDSVVVATLQAPDDEYWVTLRSCLDAQRIQRIEALRQEIDPSVSTLRLLDAALWMRASNGTNAKNARDDIPVARWGEAERNE